MEKRKKLNKAVTDSISGLLEQGINVNVTFPTSTLVRLVFFSIILTVVISGTSFALHKLKTMH